MDWLLHNPLTNLNGPQFLIFFAMVIAVILLWFYYKVCGLGGRIGESPRIAENPDPYEIAYLRGGTTELVRIIVLSLLQRGYLEWQNDEKGFLTNNSDFIAQPLTAPDARHLRELEGLVFGYFDKRRPFGEAFRSTTLRDLVGLAAQGYDAKLVSDGLLFSEEHRAGGAKYFALAIGLILGLGGYRFVTSLIKGKYNLGFLVLETVAGIGLLIMLSRSLRLTGRGREHLHSLKTAFDGYRTSESARKGHTDETLLLLASVYGISVLTGTLYGYCPRLMQQAQASQTASGGGGSGGGSCSTASSCGSSCSSGSSCGSSCGGGCGGCGGS